MTARAKQTLPNFVRISAHPNEGADMYATVRRYSNAKGLIEAIEAKGDDVKRIVGGVAGFIAYYGTRDGDNYTSITVCDGKAGCDESTRLAAEWVRNNVTQMPDKPVISAGEGMINF